MLIDGVVPGIVGILGGMGPRATADFYAKLVQATPAGTDQEHLRVVIWADPTVPDRTEALLGAGPDPTPWLVAGLRVLVDAGAVQIAMPCNTAHAFLPAARNGVGVPVLDMIGEVAKRLRRTPGVHTVGLLATIGTLRADLYEPALSAAGLTVLTPPPDAQETLVMAAVKLIKANADDRRASDLLVSAAQGLISRGAQVVIAGCTEIPLQLHDSMIDVPLVDPTQVLAEAVVAWAGSDARRANAALTAQREDELT